MVRRHLKKLVGLAMAIVLSVVIVSMRGPAAELVASLAERVEGLGWIAPIGFVALFALAVPLMVPAAPFLLAGGVLFGPVLGVLYGFAGNLVGGALAFWLARHLVRERVERRLASVTGFTVMNEALRREGVRGAALIRFSPALPAWLINYALGVSPITWKQYWLSSIAVLPGTVLFAWSGSGLGDLAALERGAGDEAGFGYYALLGAGIAGTLVASVLLGRRARRVLEAIDED